MDKMKKMLIMTMLGICIILGQMATPMVVNAVEMENIEPRMTYISSYTTDLSITSTGVATITGSVRGKSGVTSTYVKCTLQMSVSGDWVDVKSWTDSTSTRAATVAETYQLSSRGTYRVYMECSANTESKTLTSAYRTY